MSNRFSVDGPGWCQGLGRIEKIEKIEFLILMKH
jgi:hypothetical protein